MGYSMSNVSTLNYIEEFRNEMANSGIVYNGEIYPDGCIHRFHAEGDKRGSKNGWYVMHQHPMPCAMFGTWKTGTSEKWCLKNQKQMFRYESEEHRRQINDAMYQQRNALIKTQEKASIKAGEIYSASFSANKFHPYLIKKRISRFTARQKGDLLILPICDFDDNLWSLQFISHDGSKKLLSGGRKKGMYIHINGSMHTSTMILICEGFATGATIAQVYPSACVIAAIDAGNLEQVALSARMKFPKATIYIFADDDRNTKGNPGLTYGHQAAVSAGAELKSPPWPSDAPYDLTDFNDLVCWLEDHEEVISL